MLREGVGHVAPKPVPITVTESQLACILCESNKRLHHRQYHAKRDGWSEGMLGETVIRGVGKVSQAARPIFVGLLGEWAVACYFNDRLNEQAAKLDTLLRNQGDGGVDHDIHGVTMQVKTRASTRPETLIRRITASGMQVELPAKAMVACEWTGGLTVRVLGYKFTDDIIGVPLTPARRGSHLNIVVPDSSLDCMGRLLDYVAAKRASKSCH